MNIHIWIVVTNNVQLQMTEEKPQRQLLIVSINDFIHCPFVKASQSPHKTAAWDKTEDHCDQSTFKNKTVQICGKPAEKKQSSPHWAADISAITSQLSQVCCWHFCAFHTFYYIRQVNVPINQCVYFFKAPQPHPDFFFLSSLGSVYSFNII